MLLKQALNGFSVNKKERSKLLSFTFICGMDGTRTRDLLRDRQAF